MATRKPLVQVDGQIQQLQSGDDIGSNEGIVGGTNGETVTPIIFGSPVYVAGNDSFRQAQANAAPTSKVFGLSASPTAAGGAAMSVQMNNILTGTTAQWDAVTGQTGGLTANARYFLSPTTAGRLTTTAPQTTGQYVAPVGIAKSSVDMQIDIDSTILL